MNEISLTHVAQPERFFVGRSDAATSLDQSVFKKTAEEKQRIKQMKKAYKLSLANEQGSVGAMAD